MKHIAETGDLIAGRFRIERFIAEGGMGEVYEAEDQVLRERVALKFLNRRNVGNERVARRFRREILLARKVTHSNVCRLFDVFQHEVEGEPPVTFVTMEMLEGDTLEEHLQRHGPLSEEASLPLVRQMAEGLAAAHSAGVIHRDFKANNVILVPSDGFEGGLRAVITDFGLARSFAGGSAAAQSPLTGEMRVVGTVDYMAPEQLMGEEVTPTSDIYAFGVVLYEMVTDQRPYSAPNPVALLAKRVSDDPVPPSRANPQIDPHWERVILQCLEKDPARRLTTAWDVIVALTGEAVSFGPTASGTIPRPPRSLFEDTSPPTTKTVEVVRPRPWRRLGTIVALLLALLATVAFLRWRQTAPPPANPWSQTPRQLTTGGGLEIDPAFSPDGRHLAFSSDREDGFQIWIHDLDSGSERRVTRGQGLYFEPVWSPDGKYLVYHSRDRGGLWRVEAEGSLASPLTSFGSRPAWSTDGSKLIFQSASSPQLSDTTAPALATSTLWLLEVAGDPPQPVGKPRQVTQSGTPGGGHGAPSWSPNGRFVAFSASSYGSSAIWGLDVASGETFPLVDGDPDDRTHRSAYDPVYSLNGDAVYFSAGSRHVNGLWWVPVSQQTGRPTGGPQQIRNLGLASIRQLAIADDGRRIAYLAMNTGSELWRQPLDPLTAKPQGEASVLTRRGGRNNRPRFSTDGSRLAFDHWKLGDDMDIWTMDLADGQARQLTVSNGRDSQAHWMPGDRSIVFHSDRQAQRGLWSLDVDAEGAEKNGRFLLPLPEDVYWTALSPDGKHIAYHSAFNGTLALWTHNLETAEQSILVSLPDLQGGVDQDQRQEAFLGFPCWSPDGQWLAFQYKRAKDNTQIMLVGRDGRGLRQMTDIEGENWPYSFSPDGDKIAFAARRQGEWNLWWVSRTTGIEERLTHSPMLHQYYRYPTLSPTGNLLIYELAQSTGDIFLVESGDS